MGREKSLRTVHFGPTSVIEGGIAQGIATGGQQAGRVILQRGKIVKAAAAPEQDIEGPIPLPGFPGQPIRGGVRIVMIQQRADDASSRSNIRRLAGGRFPAIGESGDQPVLVPADPGAARFEVQTGINARRIGDPGGRSGRPGIEFIPISGQEQLDIGMGLEGQ